MSKKYDIKEVIQAVEILLSSENQKSLEIVNNKRKTDSNINLDEPLKLINEISPYLQQHANNPVDWYPWSEKPFQIAKKYDKPVFLSIGYSSCHWCHVIEKESFSDHVIAEYMNSNFVSIKRVLQNSHNCFMAFSAYFLFKDRSSFSN